MCDEQLKKMQELELSNKNLETGLNLYRSAYDEKVEQKLTIAVEALEMIDRIGERNSCQTAQEALAKIGGSE
jgi:hypothetical protein